MTPNDIDIHNLIEVISRSDDDGASDFVNRLADSYRDGGDLRDLIPLLESADSRLAWVGAWIVSEVASSVRGREVFEHLSKLLTHSDPSVRFAVIAGITFLVQSNESHVTKQLFLLAADENAGVRRHALFYICLIPDSVVKPLSDASILPVAKLLLSNAAKSDLISGIGSNDLLAQRMAVAGVLRNYGDTDQSLIDLIETLNDELSQILYSLPRNRMISVG